MSCGSVGTSIAPVATNTTAPGTADGGGDDVAGIAVALCSNLLQAIGLIIQKVVHVRRERELKEWEETKRPDSREELKQKAYCCEMQWVLGILIMASGSVCDVISYGLARQSLIAPFAVLSMVYNVWLAAWCVHEVVTRYDIIGTFFIVVGAASAVIFGARESPAYQAAELIERFGNGRVLAYFFCFFVYVGILAGFIRYYQRHIEKLKISLRESRPDTSDNKKEKMDQLVKYETVHPILYGALAGMFVGLTGLVTKASVEIVKDAIGFGGDGFLRWQTYFIILGVVVSMLSQITILNAGLAKYDTLIVVPVFMTTVVVGQIIAGGLYYNDFDCFDVLQTVMFPLGVGISFFGVGIMSYGRKGLGMNDKHDHARKAVEVQEINLMASA
jgi:magnesium transporter